MAISQTKTWSTVGPSAWMLVNLNSFNFGCGLLAYLNSGACTYNIEVTGQDPKLPGFGTLFNGMDNMTALTTGKNGSLQFPCTAVRINILSIQSGTPVVGLSLVQPVD